MVGHGSGVDGGKEKYETRKEMQLLCPCIRLQVVSMSVIAIGGQMCLEKYNEESYRGNC